MHVLAYLAIPLVAIVGAFDFLRPRRTTVAEVSGPTLVMDPVLATFVEVVNRASSADDPEYRRAVEGLRADPESSGRAIEQAYREASSVEPSLCHSILLAARALAAPATLDFLVTIAGSRTEVPASASESSRAVEASILRLAAVDAIEAVAAAGEDRAWDELASLIDTPDLAVQAGAAVAITHGEPDGSRRDALRARLAPDRTHLLDIRRTSVADASQVADPRRHLALPPTTVDQRPDRDAPERGTERRTPRDRVPRVDGGAS